MIGGWHYALRVLAENFVAIRCDKIINTVANECGNNLEYTRQPPRVGHSGHDLKKGATFLVHVAVLNIIHGVECVFAIVARLQMVVIHNGRTRRRLHCGQFKLLGFIKTNNKTTPAVAKFADAVEQNHFICSFYEG